MYHLSVKCFSLLIMASATTGTIHIGGSLNVLSWFGDLGSLVNVDPQQGKDPFFDGSSIDVFDEVYKTRSPLHSEDRDFDLELCPSLSSLYKALFRTYKIEGLEQPWRAFTGSWTNGAASKHLGINSAFVNKMFSYVLIRLVRRHEQVRLSSHKGLRLNNWTSERISHIVPGQVQSVLDFIQISGSHLVTGYTTGNSLYQVFVFTPTVFRELRQAMVNQDQKKLFGYFSPFYAEDIGRIVSINGNYSLESWAATHLQTRILMFYFPNLLKLRTAPELVRSAEELLGNNALLSVEMKSITTLVRDDSKRLWFQEVLDNQLKVWQENV